jgi:hypothetical protein
MIREKNVSGKHHFRSDHDPHPPVSSNPALKNTPPYGSGTPAPQSLSGRILPIPDTNFQPDPDFSFSIATAPAITNRSGKIADRFSFRNRSAILISKSIPNFHLHIDQRLKNRFRTASTDGT